MECGIGYAWWKRRNAIESEAYARIEILPGLARLVCGLQSEMRAGSGPNPYRRERSLIRSKSGDDKKQAALSFVSSAISMTDAIANKNIVDPNKFQGGLSKIIDGVVDCLNASAWAKA